jgi:surface polysaccharide O-acyltransferase-like enzyme
MCCHSAKRPVEQHIVRTVQREVHHPSHLLRSAHPAVRAAAIELPVRFPNVDAARVLAALGVVWMHTVTSPELGRYAALGCFAASPFFVSLAVVLGLRSLRRHPERGFAEFVQVRAGRLLLPFCVWNVVYVVAQQLKYLTLPTGAPRPPVSLQQFVSGAGSQLWFLPMLFLVSVPLYLVARHVVGRPTRMRGWAVVFAVLGGVLCVAPAPDFAPAGAAEYLLFKSWRVLPAVCWAVAIKLSFPLIEPTLRTSPLIAPLAVTISILCAGMLVEADTVAPYALAGVAWLLFALSPIQALPLRWLAPLGKYAFGIFLSHNLLVETVQSLLYARGRSASVETDLLVFGIAVIGSLMMSWGLSQTRFGRWLIPSR